MKIEEIMTKNLIKLTPEMEIREALKLLVENNIAGAPVTVGSKLVGIVTMRDILRYLDSEYKKQGWVLVPTPFEIIEIPRAQELPYEKITEIYDRIGGIKVSDILQKKIYTIGPEDTIEDAIQLLVRWKINRLPVIDKNGDLVGIVTRSDLLKAFLKK
jgi:CBS domain-containing protein